MDKAGDYWPAVAPLDRRAKLLQAWQEIHNALTLTISGTGLPLPASELVGQCRTSELKRYEDALDALVCAWVGTMYLQGLCAPFGDGTAAIWTP